MLDSDESEVTYTEVSSPFEDLSDIGSPRADDHEHLELPRMLEDPYVEVALQASPSLDYIPGPEETEQSPPLPDYVSGPEHPNDEIVAEDQPYAEDASPTAQSPEYVLESDLEAYPEEDDDEDPKEDPADEEEDEKEHPAPADSVVVALPAADQAPSAKETEISIPAPVPVPAWSDSEVVRLLAMSSPPSSPVSLLSSPSPWIPFPPLPPILSPPSPAASTSHSPPLPPPFILSLTRSDAPSSGIPPPLPISVPTLSPPLQLPSVSRREDRPEVTLPPRKRLGSSAAAARPAGGLKSERKLLAGWLDMLFRDRRAHAYTCHQMETEARFSREAWVRSMDASDLARGEVMSLRTTVLGQMTEIRELHATDSRRQIVTSKMLRADHRRSAEIRGLRTADRTGDSPIGTGDSLTGTGYRTTGTAGTRWRSYTARATRGGW
nr:hypothetical protein [Tanacetum cinerariifolium]